MDLKQNEAIDRCDDTTGFAENESQGQQRGQQTADINSAFRNV